MPWVQVVQGNFIDLALKGLGTSDACVDMALVKADQKESQSLLQQQ